MSHPTLFRCFRGLAAQGWVRGGAWLSVFVGWALPTIPIFRFGNNFGWWAVPTLRREDPMGSGMAAEPPETPEEPTRTRRTGMFRLRLNPGLTLGLMLT